MGKENWQKGYKEVRNIIHNEVGVTKEEVLAVFRQVAKDEIHSLVADNSPFIRQCIREVIRNEMVIAVNSHKYPKVNRSMWNYSADNTFKDYIAGVMKEEITNNLHEQFDLSVNIQKRD